MAYDAEGEHLLYEEFHNNLSRDGHTVRYAAPSGELIAEKNLDYSTRGYQPSFTLTNNITGEVLKVNTEAQALTLELLEIEQGAQPTKKSRTLTLDVNAALVVDAGFVNYLTSHWETLSAGETLSFNFLLPDHLKAYPLRAFEVACEDNSLCVRITLKNRLFAFFSSDIHLEFDRQTQRLLRYRGRSNIALNDGDYPLVDIRYRYF